MTRSHQRTILTLRQGGNEAETKTRGKLVPNSETANGPVNQRDDYKEANKTCDTLHTEYAATAGHVNTRSHPQDQV